MGFGGAAAAMITSLKNNNRRKQREAFDKFSPSAKNNSRVPIKPISKEALTKIREKIQSENKALLKKRIILFSIIVITITMATIQLIFR